MELKKTWAVLQERLKTDKAVKILCILGILGIGLIYLSSWIQPKEEAEIQAKTEENAAYTTEKALEESLERIVTAITGEEAPVVMITLENTGRTVYAADQRESDQGDTRESESNYVILRDSQGSQGGLTVTEIQPQVKGVVVVSAMAGDPIIREKLTGAVCTALDVSSAKVWVTDGRG